MKKTKITKGEHMITPNKVTKEYIVSDGTGRSATIYFMDGSFDHCDFRVSQAMYSYNDWMFLKKVAQTIEIIEKQKHK